MKNPLQKNDLLHEGGGRYFRVHSIVNERCVMIYEVSNDADGNPTTNIHPDRGEVVKRAVFVYGTPGAGTFDGRAAKLAPLPHSYIQTLKRCGENVPAR